jgi:hypothetical protein
MSDDRGSNLVGRAYGAPLDDLTHKIVGPSGIRYDDPYQGNEGDRQMNGNGKGSVDARRDTKWLITTVIAIAAASLSTFMSASWSLAEHETKIELAAKTLDAHREDLRVHVDPDDRISLEGRLVRIEALLEMAIDRLDKMSHDAKVR